MKSHKKNKRQLPDLAKESQNPIIFIRPPFRKEIGRHFNLSDSIWIYSMWPGYLDRSKALQKLNDWVKEKNIPFKILHTSGHAKLDDLKQFATSLAPKKLIPVHSFHPDKYQLHFSNVCLVADNEQYDI
jgi:ribonuclease J